MPRMCMRRVEGTVERCKASAHRQWSYMLKVNFGRTRKQGRLLKLVFWLPCSIQDSVFSQLMPSSSFLLSCRGSSQSHVCPHEQSFGSRSQNIYSPNSLAVVKRPKGPTRTVYYFLLGKNGLAPLKARGPHGHLYSGILHYFFIFYSCRTNEFL